MQLKNAWGPVVQERDYDQWSPAVQEQDHAIHRGAARLPQTSDCCKNLTYLSIASLFGGALDLDFDSPPLAHPSLVLTNQTVFNLGGALVGILGLLFIVGKCPRRLRRYFRRIMASEESCKCTPSILYSVTLYLLGGFSSGATSIGLLKLLLGLVAPSAEACDHAFVIEGDEDINDYDARKYPMCKPYAGVRGVQWETFIRNFSAALVAIGSGVGDDPNDLLETMLGTDPGGDVYLLPDADGL